MSKTLARVYSGEKFFFICGPMKLENKLSTFKIQQWDEYRIDIPLPQGRKWKESRGHLNPSKFRAHQGKFHYVSRPKNNPSWLEALSSVLLVAHQCLSYPQSYSSFASQGTIYLQASSSVIPFLTIELQKSEALLPFCFCFCPFKSKTVVFLLI